MKTTITIEELEKLCKEYDEEYGRYPESDYEGLSVFTFMIAKIGTPKVGDRRIEVCDHTKEKVEQEWTTKGWLCLHD